MINRSLVPETSIPSVLPEFSFETHVLENGVLLYESILEEELIRVSFYFKCGSLYSTKKGVVSALAKLLLSGTSKLKAYAIQEELDFYGAYTDIEAGYQHISLTVFCVKHHLEKIMRFLTEVIQNLQISHDEFHIYRNKTLENLKVSEQKTSFIAGRLFMENMYGRTHPYGRSMYAEDYAALSVEEVQAYYEGAFIQSLDHVISNTPLPQSVHDLLSSFQSQTTKTEPKASSIKAGEKRINHSFKDAVQASLFLGMPCITRHDKDYPAWSLLVTLFGGYFGSRLMKNIREDKGYTYGIGAGTHHLPDSAYLSIRSDVKNEVLEGCIDEIYKEIGRLKEEAMSEQELNTVKNYMLGSLQRGFDGSLALGDRFKTLIDQKLELDYYYQYNQSILSLTTKDIQETANKYLDINTLHVVTVGTF